MVQVNKLGFLLTKTENKFECEGVLNPAVIKNENGIHLFYRAVAHDNYSTIGYCQLSSPTEIKSRDENPVLFPQFDYEFQGLEDPRIVCIEGLYYMTYTAYDGINALSALATSSDLIHWEKQGIIVSQVKYQEFKHFIEAKERGMKYLYD
uniref:glycoside hydrolase family 130 protein n=1 Tax=Flavobacterium sp. TaxID=239 RepID=UPI00404B6D3C